MTGSVVKSVVDHSRQRENYSRVKANKFNSHSSDDVDDDDGDSIMAMAKVDYSYDEKSVMTERTEYTSLSLDTDTVAGGKSFRSIGSLSTYLARTSRVPRGEA